MAEVATAELLESLSENTQANASVLKELKVLTKEISKLLVGKKAEIVKPVEKSVTDAPREQDTSATDVALEKKEPSPVIIQGFSNEAFKKLEILFEKLTGREAPAQQKPQPTGDKSLFGSLIDGLFGKLNLKDLLSKSAFGKLLSSGLLKALGGLGVSLALAIGSWFNDGPWKGTMKLIGEIGTKVFLPKVTKILTTFFPELFESFAKGFQTIGKTLGTVATKLLPSTGVLGQMAAKFLGFFTPLLKRLPVIGTIINVGSAISRFIKGDVLGGLIDLGSAIAVLIPGVGTAISLGLGLLNAGRDLTGDSKKPVTEQLGGVFGKAWEWIKTKFKEIFTSWFGKIGRGIEQIKAGEYFRGIVTLASFVPGFGWMESLYNWVAGPMETPPENEGQKEPEEPGVLSKAWNWLKLKLKDRLTAWFKKFSKGWEQIKSGEYFRGIVTWASSIPGFGWLESVYNWATGPDEEPEVETASTAESFNWSKIFTTIKDSIKSKLKSVIDSLKKLPFVPDALVDKINSALGLDSALSTEAVSTSKVPDFDTKESSKSDVVSEKESAVNSLKKDQATEKAVQNQTTLGKQKTEIVDQNNKPTSTDTSSYTSKLTRQQKEQETKRQEVQKEVEKIKPQAPDTLPLTPASSSKEDLNQELLKKIADLLEKSHTADNKKNISTTNATSTVAAADNSAVNVYNLGSDRDIPYVERNKYRQQLLYIRGIL